MTTDRAQAIEALLSEAKDAHGVYETNELNGVYDLDWPRWYAGYAVEHGIGAILGRAISTDELADFLTRSWEELQRADQPTEPWAALTARRIASELEASHRGD
jgi:hypothetical protein